MSYLGQGSAVRSVSTPSARNPGSTAWIRHRARNSRPDDDQQHDRRHHLSDDEDGAQTLLRPPARPRALPQALRSPLSRPARTRRQHAEPDRGQAGDAAGEEQDPEIDRGTWPIGSVSGTRRPSTGRAAAATAIPAHRRGRRAAGSRSGAGAPAARVRRRARYGAPAPSAGRGSAPAADWPGWRKRSAGCTAPRRRAPAAAAGTAAEKYVPEPQHRGAGLLVLPGVLPLQPGGDDAKLRCAPARLAHARAEPREHVEVVVVAVLEVAGVEGQRHPQRRRRGWGNGSPRGITPMTTYGLPSSRSRRPSTPASPPNRDCQSPWLRTMVPGAPSSLVGRGEDPAERGRARRAWGGSRRSRRPRQDGRGRPRPPGSTRPADRRPCSRTTVPAAFQSR